MLFVSRFSVSTDTLSRLVLPKPFRSGPLARGGLLFIRPSSGYLIACCEPYLRELLDRIAPGDPLDEDTRSIKRDFMQVVTPVHVDPQGRFNISALFGIKPGDICVFVGLGDEFEIWRESDWVERYGDSGGSEDVR